MYAVEQRSTRESRWLQHSSVQQAVIQQIDTSMQLNNEPDRLFVAGFMGSPAMNSSATNSRTTHGRGSCVEAAPCQRPERRAEPSGRFAA
jgi:ABC-type sugar transport system ATPase subunit